MSPSPASPSAAAAAAAVRALATAGLLLPAALAGPYAAAAEAPAPQTVTVLNGDFADPVMKGDGPTTVALDSWDGRNQRYSPSASGRTDNAHGVALEKQGNSPRSACAGSGPERR